MISALYDPDLRLLSAISRVPLLVTLEAILHKSVLPITDIDLITHLLDAR